MNSIKSIELLFDSDIFIKGEALYQQGAVQEIIKLNASLFTLVVRDGKTYEVELLKPLIKGQKFSCDCTFYKSNKTCKHIVASLLYFSQHKDRFTKDKQKIKKEKQKYKSITTRTLLSKISDQSLRHFVLGYASRDKKFSDALKVNFIRQIDLEDNERKYKTLLDSLIKPISSKNKELKESELRNFKKVIRDLLEQAYDALALKEYLEASYIIKTVLLKLHYIDHYFPSRIEDLIPFFKDFYALYKELLSKNDLAVDLKIILYENLIELVSSSFYHSKLNVSNGFEILINYFSEHDKILTILNEYVSAPKISKEELGISYSQIFKVKKILKYNSPFELSKSLSPITEKIIKNTIETGNIDLAEQIADQFRKEFPDEIVYTALLLEMYLKSNKENDFVNTLISTFLKTRNLRLIDLIHQYKLSHMLDEVRHRMKDQIPKEMNIYTKANFFKKLQDWDGLMSLMYEIKDIRTLMEYDKPLYKAFPDEVTYLYMMLIEDYLDKHLGDFAAVFIDELSIHLKKKNLVKILSKMNKLIAEKYSHRTKLAASIFK
jgi:hypothetical protein